jgi:hypothetical protein
MPVDQSIIISQRNNNILANEIKKRNIIEKYSIILELFC